MVSTVSFKNNLDDDLLKFLVSPTLTLSPVGNVKALPLEERNGSLLGSGLSGGDFFSVWSFPGVGGRRRFALENLEGDVSEV